MKTVIQHTDVPLYWTAKGAWTNNPREALAFLDEPRAMDYAFYHDIPHARAALLPDPRPSSNASPKMADDRRTPRRSPRK